MPHSSTVFTLESPKAVISNIFLQLVVTSCNFSSLRGDPGELCAKMGGEVHRFPPIFRGGSVGKWVPSPWFTFFDVSCEVKFGQWDCFLCS